MTTVIDGVSLRGDFGTWLIFGASSLRSCMVHIVEGAGGGFALWLLRFGMSSAISRLCLRFCIHHVRLRSVSTYRWRVS